jgi:flagellar operon protein
MTEINGISVPFIPITQVGDLSSTKVQSSGETSFNSIFQDELEKIKFSSHALKRLENRNIQLNESDITKIQNAVTKAEQKGSKDSLVMVNDTAYIVNIPNRTVVTAMPVNESSDNVFTNIDSVVFA